MATHTPAQAIQELVNHTAVLTERLVGLQQEVRKGMNMTPEWGNALTQVVGDTKRMLQAMEHLARLPAFHLDREGLNAAVVAGVQQGLMAGGGNSLVEMIESNTRHLDEAKQELSEAKKRMDDMMAEMQSARTMSPENRQQFFMQFAPIVGIWSAGLLIAGLMLGKGCASSAPVQPQQTVPAVVQQATPAAPTVGSVVPLPRALPLYATASSAQRPAFNGVAGMAVTIMTVQPDGWIQVNFAVSTDGKRASGWLAPNSLR